MKKIAVVFGGSSVEHDVSIVTGLQCINNLTDFYKIYPIYLTKDNKFFLSNHLKPKDYLNKEEVVK
ncbi:MAG: D-alanine--D-alanine ligase, partial [Clostridia bacterium]|nr:D-alanine--D-alanine ligase [Clostridia bacterium]